MRVVQNSETVTLKITENDVLKDKWIPCINVSKILLGIENNKDMRYKCLRTKFYNSLSCEKYNTVTIAGLKCIDTSNPMKATASLELVFEYVKE